MTSPTRELFTEQYELIDTMYQLGVAANNEANSGYNSIATMHDVVVIIHPLDVNDVLDVDIEQGTTTGGGGAKALSSSEFDASIATADTKPTVICIPGDAFDVDGGFDCINIEVTTADTGGGGNDYLVEVWGRPRYKPASTANLDSVISR